MGKDLSCFDLICLRRDFTMEPGLESVGCLDQTQIHDPSLQFPCFYITDLSIYLHIDLCMCVGIRGQLWVFSPSAMWALGMELRSSDISALPAKPPH